MLVDTDNQEDTDTVLIIVRYENKGYIVGVFEFIAWELGSDVEVWGGKELNRIGSVLCKRGRDRVGICCILGVFDSKISETVCWIEDVEQNGEELSKVGDDGLWGYWAFVVG